MEVLILGASYGSLLSTKLLMAGHNVTLVCLPHEAELINRSGTEVRLKLRAENTHRSLLSDDLPGTLDATTPAKADLARYDLVGLAMQEPQFSAAEVKALMARIAQAQLPCLSIMNMPPLAYLRRIPALASMSLDNCFRDASVWAPFDPDNITLCSPDPQAFRPPDEALNVLHVGLPTNFKAARFAKPEHQSLLQQLSSDIAALRLDDQEVPVKLKVHDSLFVPMAKWSMLLTGNYRCITEDGIRPIKEAVHSNAAESANVYAYVDELVRSIGGDSADAVPFEKYANAAESLLKPSSAARAIDAGATHIERVDRMVQTIGRAIGMQHPSVDQTVAVVDARLAANLEQQVVEPA
ncbi:MAG: hypothetical protein AAF404_17910 [Pseudomonadota bacterium]